MLSKHELYALGLIMYYPAVDLIMYKAWIMSMNYVLNYVLSMNYVLIVY